MEIVHQHFITIDSTNTWAKLNAHLLPRDKITLITADGQTAGRGRFKRQWVSPPGQNIYATFCFFIEKNRKDIGNIPQVLAIAVANILDTLGFKTSLKWPNDVLISKKKVAGILAETTHLSDQMCMIVGIGLNVNMPLEVLKAIDKPATSLFAETGELYDVQNVLQLLQKQFSKDLELFLEKGFHSFLKDYRQRLSGGGQLVRFNDNCMIWEGKISAINEDGSLRMLLLDGSERTFVAGEILWPGE